MKTVYETPKNQTCQYFNTNYIPVRQDIAVHRCFGEYCPHPQDQRVSKASK